MLCNMGWQMTDKFILAIERRTLLRYHAWQFGLAAALRLSVQDKRKLFQWRYNRKRDAVNRMALIELASAYQSGRLRKPITTGTRIM